MPINQERKKGEVMLNNTKRDAINLFDLDYKAAPKKVQIEIDCVILIFSIIYGNTYDLIVKPFCSKYKCKENKETLDKLFLYTFACLNSKLSDSKFFIDGLEITLQKNIINTFLYCLYNMNNDGDPVSKKLSICKTKNETFGKMLYEIYDLNCHIFDRDIFNKYRNLQDVFNSFTDQALKDSIRTITNINYKSIKKMATDYRKKLSTSVIKIFTAFLILSCIGSEEVSAPAIKIDEEFDLEGYFKKMDDMSVSFKMAANEDQYNLDVTQKKDEIDHLQKYISLREVCRDLNLSDLLKEYPEIKIEEEFELLLKKNLIHGNGGVQENYIENTLFLHKKGTALSDSDGYPTYMNKSDIFTKMYTTSNRDSLISFFYFQKLLLDYIDLPKVYHEHFVTDCNQIIEYKTLLEKMNIDPLFVSDEYPVMHYKNNDLYVGYFTYCCGEVVFKVAKITANGPEEIIEQLFIIKPNILF